MENRQETERSESSYPTNTWKARRNNLFGFSLFAPNKRKELFFFALPIIFALSALLTFYLFVSLYVDTAAVNNQSYYKVIDPFSAYNFQSRMCQNSLLDALMYLKTVAGDPSDPGVAHMNELLGETIYNGTYNTLEKMFGTTVEETVHEYKEFFEFTSWQDIVGALNLDDLFFKNGVAVYDYNHRFDQAAAAQSMNVGQLTMNSYQKYFIGTINRLLSQVPEILALVEERNNNSISQDTLNEAVSRFEKNALEALGNSLESMNANSLDKQFALKNSLVAPQSLKFKNRILIFLSVFASFIIINMVSSIVIQLWMDRNLKYAVESYCFMTPEELSYHNMLMRNRLRFFQSEIDDDGMILNRGLTKPSMKSTNKKGDLAKEKERERTRSVLRIKKLSKQGLSFSVAVNLIIAAMLTGIYICMTIFTYSLTTNVNKIFEYQTFYIDHASLTCKLVDNFMYLNIFVLFGNYFNINTASDTSTAFKRSIIQDFTDFWVNGRDIKKELMGEDFYNYMQQTFRNNSCYMMIMDRANPSTANPADEEPENKICGVIGTGYTEGGLITFLNHYQDYGESIIESLKAKQAGGIATSRNAIGYVGREYWYDQQFVQLRTLLYEVLELVFPTMEDTTNDILAQFHQTFADNLSVDRSWFTAVIVIFSTIAFTLSLRFTFLDMNVSQETFRVIPPEILTANAYISNRFNYFFSLY